MSTATLEKMFKESDTLTSAEKITLAEHLWPTVPDDHEIENAWLIEAQKRSKEIDEGGAVLVPWTELQAELKSHLEKNRNNP